MIVLIHDYLWNFWRIVSQENAVPLDISKKLTSNMDYFAVEVFGPKGQYIEVKITYVSI